MLLLPSLEVFPATPTPPPADITDKDALEVGKFDYINLPFGNKIVEVVKQEIIAKSQYCYEQYTFLTQQGYSIPLFFGVNHWANSKNAIELGIAIKK